MNANYRDAYAESYTGYLPEDIKGNEGMEVMLGMVMWGFGSIDDNGALVTAVLGNTYDLVQSTSPPLMTTMPKLTLLTKVILLLTLQLNPRTKLTFLAMSSHSGLVTGVHWMRPWAAQGVPNISGIVKVDDYTVQVTLNGFEAPAVYSVLGVQATPLHYYGDVAKYDYENNMFGFDFGDLSKQESLTATPMGAGPYKFVKYDNRVVYFEANEYYFRGCPKIAEVQFKETASAEVPSALQTGTADAGEMSYNSARYAEVKSYNSNGEMTGDVITSSMVDNLGYGYIGINADTVNVGGDPASEASKNLRRAYATIFAVHRDVAIDSYYGEGASVINYPISNTSWAAPQPTDEGYEIAFSTDVNGDPIYTADMTMEDKYAAAEAAALGFLEAAGFTVENGKVVAAPEGAKMRLRSHRPR